MNELIRNNNDRFGIARTDAPPREMVIRYGQSRSIRKYICVVEGSTDEHFYSHSCLSHLRLDSCIYVYRKSYDNDEYRYKGKEAVIRTLRDVSANKDLSRELSRTFFIIDRDFENEPTCQESRLSEDEKKRFTLTPHHSMECFFLTTTNLTKLFEFLDVPANLKDKFLILLTKFRDEVADYFAYFSASPACYNHGWRKLKPSKTYECDDIFIFSFSDMEYNFKREWMIEEISNRKPEVENHSYAYGHYKEVKKSIMSNYLFIRGHTLADFLQEFLAQCCKITFEKKLSQADKIMPFIRNMDVSLDLVFGNGMPVGNSNE